MMEDDAVLNFGTIVEYAALRYHSQKYSESLPLRLFKYILALMVSKSVILHIISHRILINLTDRHSNKIEFETPRIFFKGVSYNIRMAKYSVTDRTFFKSQRLNLHKCLVEGLKNHYDHKINLENMYTSLAILCVEIPCAYVASSLVSLCMGMQDHVLQTKPSDMEACHHVHAVIMSLMSLVCYVHKAEVFYSYVTLIMERRSEWAPHLNPPTKVRYAYAQHHILWDKPDLFFEDWEARFGLWKCFRTKKKAISGEDLVVDKNQ